MPSPGITDARTSFDGLYAGSFLAAAFCGFTSHQTYVYFKHSTRDPSWMRHTVFTLWIGDVMHAVLGAISTHQVAIEFIEDPSGLLQNTVPWTLSASFFLMVITDTAVKSFYCYRIWRLSHRDKIVTTIAVLPVLCALVAGLYAAVRTAGTSDVIAIDLLAQIEATLISALISDVLLAGLQCILLWKVRSEFEQATSLISLLVLYVVTTGVLTSVVAIATLAIMLRIRHSFAYDGAFYMLSRMYFSSLLATLNRREGFRGLKRSPGPSKNSEVFPLPATGQSRVEFGPETLEQHSGRLSNTSAHRNPPPIQIDIMVERSISLNTHRRDPPLVGPSGSKTQLSFGSYQDTERSNTCD